MLLLAFHAFLGKTGRDEIARRFLLFVSFDCDDLRGVRILRVPRDVALRLVHLGSSCCSYLLLVLPVALVLLLGFLEGLVKEYVVLLPLLLFLPLLFPEHFLFLLLLFDGLLPLPLFLSGLQLGLPLLLRGFSQGLGLGRSLCLFIFLFLFSLPLFCSRRGRHIFAQIVLFFEVSYPRVVEDLNERQPLRRIVLENRVYQVFVLRGQAWLESDGAPHYLFLYLPRVHTCERCPAVNELVEKNT